MGTPYKVTSVLTEKEGQPPVLMEFENGKINPDLPEPLKCKIFKDDIDPLKKYLTVENNETTYIGCTDNANSLSHTYLAIRNRETHEVQLVKVETVRATAAVGREVQHIANKADEVGENALLNLSRKFGSKAAKRLHEQKLRAHLVAKSDDHLRKVVQDRVIEANELQPSTDDSLETLLPPCNTNASSPNEVYDLNDILTDTEMKTLQEGFEAKEAEEEETFLKKCSPLFNSLLDKCMKNAKHVTLLLYAEYLIRLCNKRRLRNLFEICDSSEEIALKMSREFTSKKGKERTVTKVDIDKMILRIIIITLNLSEFTLQILPLANSLQYVNTTRIKLLVRVVGASFANKSSDTAVLKLPITRFNLNAIPFKKRRR